MATISRRRMDLILWSVETSPNSTHNKVVQHGRRPYLSSELWSEPTSCVIKLTRLNKLNQTSYLLIIDGLQYKLDLNDLLKKGDNFCRHEVCP